MPPAALVGVVAAGLKMSPSPPRGRVLLDFPPREPEYKPWLEVPPPPPEGFPPAEGPPRDKPDKPLVSDPKLDGLSSEANRGLRGMMEDESILDVWSPGRRMLLE